MFSIRPLPIISLIFATFNSVGQLLLILLFISIGVPLSDILCNPLFRFAISLSLSLSLFPSSFSLSLALSLIHLSLSTPIIHRFFVNIIIIIITFTSQPLNQKQTTKKGIINEFVISVSFCAGVFFLFSCNFLSRIRLIPYSFYLILNFFLNYLPLLFLSFSVFSFFFSLSLSLYTTASCNELDNVSRWLRFGVFYLSLFFFPFFSNCIIGIALTCR